MLCPRCNAVNKDDAGQCRECGTRLAGIRVTRDARNTESKYLVAGIISFVGIILIIVLLISTVSCIVGDSCANGGEDHINESVDGEWDAVGSGTDVVSPADLPVDDAVPPADTGTPAA